ncbi:hypothetical protein F5Y19DRAFT_422664 [Xylariaceae sp. FL1651]|nr:hypothetical protein F5Y19DRAFT_422664 [Xylariaceae sp. FL1651]
MHIAQPSRVLDDPRWNRAIASLSGPALVSAYFRTVCLVVSQPIFIPHTVCSYKLPRLS